MSQPLVSVICLCYNHRNFVQEAIESVLRQDYPSIELILVDDASQDGSQEIILEILNQHPEIKYISHKTNRGNCASFNAGFRISGGNYIIDLAADDVLMPDRVTKGVSALVQAGESYGVQFSDAIIINKNGEVSGYHSDKYPHHSIPQGDIYLALIGRYFISSPTMMIRREVLETLHGYDEKLAYEDFDFWIRSARRYKYVYLPLALIKRRHLADSMRSHQFKRGSQQLRSTLAVCKKIKKLNITPEENRALRNRIKYEMKVALKLMDWPLLFNYIKILFNR